MKKVLWISRHTMTSDQFNDLRRIYDTDLEVIQEDKSIKNITEVSNLIEQADIIGAVLPIELLQELLQIAKGKPVLVSKNERIPTGNMLKLADGTLEKEYQYKHAGWKQMVKIDIVTKDL